MLKIERDGNQFKVTAVETGLGRFGAKARNINEVCRTVRHYYDGHNHPVTRNCPFCVLCEKESRKEAKRLRVK